MLGWFVSALALAAPGYGDPTDGLPGVNERALHLWTNAARIDPEAFEADYNRGGCSFDVNFSADEQTPKWPLPYSYPLTDAAEFHTIDMAENDWFDHASSDGTSFPARLARYYPSSNVGENIAVGYADEYEVVFAGWMCSEAGHRANIMSGGWDALGVGVVGAYYTQDFGGSGAPLRAIAMGAHWEESGAVTFRGDFWDEGGADPDAYVVVLDGTRHDMELEYGEAGRAIYTTEVEAGDGCHQYYLEAVVGGAATRFPETGSYGWGGCDFDDAEAGWLADQLGASGDDDAEAGARDGFELVRGCDTARGASGLVSALIAAGVLGRRRRAKSCPPRRIGA